MVVDESIMDMVQWIVFIQDVSLPSRCVDRGVTPSMKANEFADFPVAAV